VSREVRLVAPGDAEALARLFERAGAACHCRYWHFQGTKNEWLERCAFGVAESARELEAAVRGARDDDGRGVIALEGGEVIGWAKLFPKPAAAKLLKLGPYNAYSKAHTPDTWCIGCVLVDPAQRRSGVARALALGCAEAARALGAAAIEAFPRVGHGVVADEELQMGVARHFEEAGFVAVAGEAPYPIYRLELGAAAG
jgi:predicted N-acetyltransferase YhbS